MSLLYKVLRSSVKTFGDFIHFLLRLDASLLFLHLVLRHSTVYLEDGGGGYHLSTLVAVITKR